MTSAEFQKWIAATYGRGKLLELAADFNATADTFNAPRVTVSGDGKRVSALNTWLYGRNPPAQYGGMSFEDFLAHVVARKHNPAAAVKAYRVTLTADAEASRVIEALAMESKAAPETLLAQLLEAAVTNTVANFNARPKKKKRSKP